jgi:hypothetical protein
MNIISITTVLTIIASILKAAVAIGHAGMRLRRPTEAECGELIIMVRQRASTEELLAFLDGSILDCSTYIWYYISDALAVAIISDQVEVLQTLLPRIRFPQEAVQKLLIDAMSHHKIEACRILMSQVARLEYVPGQPSRIPFWQGMARSWQVQELIDLVDAHPGFAMNLPADKNDMKYCVRLQTAFDMLQFNSHFASKDPAFAALKYSQPSALLKGLLKNGVLNDINTALVVRRICETGTVEVTQEMFADFKKQYPYHEQTQQALSDWIEEDIKVPEEDADRTLSE